MQQKLAAGGYLDLLTKDELSQAMGHNFDDAIRDLLRGIDYLSFVGVATPNTGLFTIPYVPDQGYTWSVKLVAFTLSANAQPSVYLGSDTTQAPIAFPGFNTVAVATFSANQVVIKDGTPITVFGAGGATSVLNYRLHVKQVPTEMQGKL